MTQRKSTQQIRWNMYNIGETRNLMMKEINQIVAKKEHRRKVGLETGALSEFKGKSHWNVFMAIELAEMMTKRLNSDMRIVFVQTTQGINNTNAFLTNLSQQLKKVEYNLSNVNTVSSNNTIKIIQNEVAKLNRMLANMTALEKKIQSASAKILTNVDTTSKMLVDTINQNNENLKSDLNERFQNFEDLTNNKFNDITEKMDEIDNKTKENLQGLSRQIEDVRENTQDYETNLKNFQAGTTHMLDDLQTNTIHEFQEGIGGILKQNMENFESLKELQTTNSTELTTRINESSEDITSIMEATNEHLDKVYDKLKENLDAYETNMKKELKDEITDLRTTILSTIRNDIELMKSVVNKIDSKTH